MKNEEYAIMAARAAKVAFEEIFVLMNTGDNFSYTRAHNKASEMASRMDLSLDMLAILNSCLSERDKERLDWLLDAWMDDLKGELVADDYVKIRSVIKEFWDEHRLRA